MSTVNNKNSSEKIKKKNLTNKIKDVSEPEIIIEEGKKDNTTENRGEWNSTLQFILTCVGFAVGLGNIWRFPSVAYENGGAAFLIPYLICSITLGLPVLILEMALGQSLNSGPATAYGKIVPMMKGLGWGMICCSTFLSTFYAVVISWIFYYIVKLITGGFSDIVTCDNSWNTIFCFSIVEELKCKNESFPDINYIFFNDTCLEIPKNMTPSIFREITYEDNNLDPSRILSAAEEYFYRSMLQQESDFINNILKPNWKLFLCYTAVYIIVVLIVWKVFFIYGLTLDGSSIGIRYYLLEPDFSKLLSAKTWKAAATQLCFSLSVGIGGILSLSSYNDKHHNFYKDALIIVFADGFMSVFGGVTVFSILGFMAKQLGQEINEVVKSGTSLAFIAYPEAASLTTFSTIFSLLFFIMLFLLGVSTQVCIMSSLSTGLYDQFESLRKHKEKLSFLAAIVTYIAGFLMTFKSGKFLFEIFNQFSASFNLLGLIGLECITITYIYGIKNFQRDIREMLGKPTNWFMKIFGPSGHYFAFCLMIIVPILTLILSIYEIVATITNELVYGSGDYIIVIPPGLTILGWVIGIIPLLFVFGAALTDIIKRKISGKGVIGTLKPNSKHSSIHLYEPPFLVRKLEEFIEK
ncbi:Sodium-dependent dopamine transporter [Strongyloides ratti]|uniref:Sodium-dependent dopamine transporter n=1 Tax=Strongyloides ratti TaxID=34506 RepID=A0A090MX99_STRRB|nr:Sodium-dependent dopamine transporter [Strongyloides ratti]CEF65064.1 Sodium-dependent dopamine transporter [Strongyloides ratti]